MATKSKAPTFPKSIGATIDLLYTLRSQRLEEEKRIESMKSQEAALKAHIMTNFAQSDIDGAKGKLATASIKRSTQAEVMDWDLFWAYIGKTKDWELLQKRVGITALRERWDHGKNIPGVEPRVIEDLSLTKVSQ